MKQSAVKQAADALRLWSNAWNEFDKTGKNKPASIEEVIEPFIQMEEQEKIDFADKYGTYLLQGGIMSAAAYNETFKSE